MPAGQGAGGITDVLSCAEIIERVLSEAKTTAGRVAALAEN